MMRKTTGRRGARAALAAAVTVTAVAAAAGCGGSGHKASPPPSSASVAGSRSGTGSTPTGPASGPGSTSSSSPSAPGSTSATAGMRLSLAATGLAAGGLVRFPFTLDYGLTGPAVAALHITGGAGFHLRVTTSEPGGPPSGGVEVPIDAATGTAVVHVSPKMTGTADLTIAVVGPDGRVLAQTTYAQVRIDGPQ